MKAIIELVGTEGEIAINGVTEVGYYLDAEDGKIKVYIDQDDEDLMDFQFFTDIEKIKSFKIID